MGCGASREISPLSIYPGADDFTQFDKNGQPMPNGTTAGDKFTDVIHNGFGSSNANGTGKHLLGKHKYVKEYGALIMSDRNGVSTDVGTLFLFCAADCDDLVVSYRDSESGSVYAKRYTDAELEEAKANAGVGFSWAPFFKSVASALIKSTAVVVSVSDECKEVIFTIANSKESTQTYPFTVPLALVSDGRKPEPLAVFEFTMEPLAHALRYQRNHYHGKTREVQITALESESIVQRAAMRTCQATVDQLLPAIRPLREEAAICSHLAINSGREIRELTRRIESLKEEKVYKHPLDHLYDEGGPQFFHHVPWTPEHHPHEEEPSTLLSACIRAAFPLAADSTLDGITNVFDRPDLKKLVDSSDEHDMIVEAFEIFKGVDLWDYDTIQLEIITNGNALFYTTYLLMYKLDLVRHFNIDDQVLRNFLAAIQAYYHSNPYHNAMHGADVTQINYYIMIIAGLRESCKLSKEEILAGLLAGPIHDVDHPGLNNNFHSRTNAYLATMYNDRSILENHHLACTFELLNHPRYDVFASLTEEQRQVVREVILEMVLATDMGNHASIFKTFQMRMSDTSDWHSKKENVRLALSMSIKMADISNCARPNHIYEEWSRNIAEEFYLQGDAERKLSLSVSPFMDRTKSAEEFAKGQISFMMYIVQPMVEALSVLLPSLSFAINLCNENKEYWRQKTGATQHHGI